MTPIEIACRHVDKDSKNCAAEAGQPCVWPHPWAEMMGFHAERIEDAAVMGNVGAAPAAAAFESAVEKSGKV